jgi:GNAT superfamily N-acetyltransferase
MWLGHGGGDEEGVQLPDRPFPVQLRHVPILHPPCDTPGKMLSMGRASRRRAEARTGQRATRKDRRFRPAGPGDAARITELLELAEWEDPRTPQAVGTAVAMNMRAPTAGYWVADSAEGSVVGVLLAGAPTGWIDGLASFGHEAQSHMERRVIDLESLVVAPEARGQGLGKSMVDHVANAYRRRGYRLMSGSFYAHQSYLGPYYEQMGFTVRPPGQPLYLWIPRVEGVLSYPADAHMQQMWRALTPEVGLVRAQDPDGVRIAIDGVL